MSGRAGEAEPRRRGGAPVDCFGLELRLAGHIAEGGDVLDWTGAAAPAGYDCVVRRFFLRPASEPIIWSWWDNLDRRKRGLADVTGICDCLLGAPARQRDYVRSGRGGYAPLVTIEARLQALSALEIADFADPVDWAAARFVAFVQAHPFADGNGRTGRALIQLDLRAAGLLSAPVLPLGPVMYAHAPAIAAALARGDQLAARAAVRTVMEAAWRAGLRLQPALAADARSRPVASAIGA